MTTTGRAQIVGAFEHPLREAPGCTNLRFIAECAREALDDAGLQPTDVDGLCTTGDASTGLYVAEHLDLHPTWIDTTTIGGSSFLLHLMSAADAIAAGRCEVVLIVYGSVALTGAQSFGTRISDTYQTDPMNVDDIERTVAPYGIPLAAQYAMVATSHMHRFGTTSDQLARVAVAARTHAGNNPLARYRDPITVDDVLASPMIASPLHLLDCCVITDGGGALVVTSAAVARGTKQPPIEIIGGSVAVAHLGSGIREPLSLAGARSGPAAFQRTGVSPIDVDLCMIYDSFTISVITALEDLRFCRPGEAADFVGEGYIDPGGSLPVNPDGGALSNHHPGRRGLFLAIEAVRQLRGAAGPRQVEGACTALCHGIGGFLSGRHSAVTVLLGSGGG